jgi:hypothetical protein
MENLWQDRGFSPFFHSDPGQYARVRLLKYPPGGYIDTEITDIQLFACHCYFADVWVMLNKIASKNVADRLTSRLTECGVKVIGEIPMNDEIFESCLDGRPIQEGVAAKEIDRILNFLFP